MARRSVLFSPGDRPEMMRKAPGIGADVVIFDLEDAVAPERKAEARDAVSAVLTDDEFDPDCEVCVRVNPIGTVTEDDLDGILQGDSRLDAIMLPKATGAGDVDTLDELLQDRGYDLPVFSLVESAAGVLNAADIAAASATSALVFGAEDLAADLGATRTEEGTEVLYAREHAVLAASAAGVDAIDTVHTAIRDTEGLRAETEFAIQLGYDGKMAIHPSQVTVINEAFTPEPERVEWAKTVLTARDEAAVEGRGVFRVNDEMIDAPLIAQAERIVERARAANLLWGGYCRQICRYA
ncbi:HpcH/HpaI aldolase/citrate lyase family protein [Haladaptatus sp. GCM10025707]|uniref:HpcH/HpaI aldolase/citrate lyase family protein n=2 Tax=unclassified Haladaptatus TaxID=2622732 RepID=UPI003613B5A0